MTEETQQILNAFNGYHELTNRRIKIAAAFRELVNQFRIQYDIEDDNEDDWCIHARDVLRICDELEKF